MTDEKNKSKPIPTRHDPDIVEMVDRLNRVTGIGKAEIIRRAVRYALLKAKEDGSLNFLLGDPADIRKALTDSRLENPGEAPDPVIYPAEPSPVTLATRLNEPDPKSREVGEGIAKAALDAIIRNAGAVKAEQLRRQLDPPNPDPEDHPHPETSNGDPVEK